MTLDVIPALLSGIAALALAGLVWSRAPEGTPNRAFAWGMTGLGLTRLGQVMLLAGAPATREAWLQAVLAAEALMLPGWAVFSVTFARAAAQTELRRWRTSLAVIAVVALATAAAAALEPLAASPWPVPETFLPLTGSGKAVVTFALLATVFVLFQLEATLRQSAGVARWQIKYFVLGTFGVFGLHIFVLSHALLVNGLRRDHLVVEAVASLIAFGLIAFSLVRHRLLDVNVFVSRHVVYHSLTVIAVGAYLIVVGLAGWVMQTLDIRPSFFLAALTIFLTTLALAIALLSEAVRHRVKRVIVRHFYAHKYDYRWEWTHLTRSLTSAVSTEAIAPRIVGAVAQTMGSRTALFLPEDTGRFHLVDSIGPRPDDTLDVDAKNPALVRLAREGAPLRVTEVGRDHALSGVMSRLQAGGYAFMVPLAASDETLGLLAVGPPTASDPTNEDDELLETIAAQAAMALLNTRLAEQVAQARELEALNRVSSFILHDLKNCVSMLSLVAQNAESLGSNAAFRRDAFRTVGQSAHRMQQLIDRLSHLPKGLELRLAPTDLNAVVEDAVSRTRLAVNGGISVATALDALPAVVGDEEQIGRVLDNLLINAVEALAGKGTIEVRTAAGNGSATLAVSDTGPGIPDSLMRAGLFAPFRTTKPHGLGIGLYQARSIVQAHGGDIDVTSRPGEGTTVTLRFPVATEAAPARQR